MSSLLTFEIDEAFIAAIQPDQLTRAVELTLQRFFHSSELPALTLVITDNETIQQLNHQYRGIAAPTDVLSFANPPDPDFPGSDQAYLGDVIMAYPLAEAQAQAGGHTPEQELTLLAVHGTLHLLGFDHDTPANKMEMWAVQQEIMAELGLGHIQPTEN
jgi:probable rRNA maturation factor